ncbi:NAD(P)/FAD-dependent oxidoreductase [Moorella sp. Hama-1]|uniref:NAD(P)/FAD-dependent oxidoreductase n=1 Tax=Moorella sp. Hama-1 TaxID=2138101 RepID=UPI000D659641|nr:FAD-dependent oxidoreductase [Moorella sp. Hama-1]BCV23096.1 sarcosine oxidase subunit beta [Moorella sp. Hama-1]
MLADIVIIGGGYFGASAAYHLALRGFKIILVDRREVASGASGGNFGRVQLQDAELGLSLDLSLLSWQRILNLQEELDMDIEFRRSGSLIIATSPQEWEELQEFQQRKMGAGLEIELLEKQEVKEIEPHLNTELIKGASYCLEGQLNPFKLIYAFLHKASVRGCKVLENTPVTGFKVVNGKIKEVITSRGKISTNIVVVTTGAWTKMLGREMGLDIPVDFVWGEALVTEKAGPLLQNYFSLASFFESEHLNKNEPCVSLCCTCTNAGNLLIGETMMPGSIYQLNDSKGYLARKENLPFLARELARFFPGLSHLKVIRSWRVPVACTSNHRPYLGFWGPENMILAAGFKSSAIMTPIAGEIIAELAARGKYNLDLSEFQGERSKCLN